MVEKFDPITESPWEYLDRAGPEIRADQARADQLSVMFETNRLLREANEARKDTEKK